MSKSKEETEDRDEQILNKSSSEWSRDDFSTWLCFVAVLPLPKSLNKIYTWKKIHEIYERCLPDEKFEKPENQPYRDCKEMFNRLKQHDKEFKEQVVEKKDTSYFKISQNTIDKVDEFLAEFDNLSLPKTHELKLIRLKLNNFINIFASAIWDDKLFQDIFTYLNPILSLKTKENWTYNTFRSDFELLLFPKSKCNEAEINSINELFCFPEKFEKVECFDIIQKFENVISLFQNTDNSNKNVDKESENIIQINIKNITKNIKDINQNLEISQKSEITKIEEKFEELKLFDSEEEEELKQNYKRFLEIEKKLLEKNQKLILGPDNKNENLLIITSKTKESKKEDLLWDFGPPGKGIKTLTELGMTSIWSPFLSKRVLYERILLEKEEVNLYFYQGQKSEATTHTSQIPDFLIEAKFYSSSNLIYTCLFIGEDKRDLTKKQKGTSFYRDRAKLAISMKCAHDSLRQYQFERDVLERVLITGYLISQNQIQFYCLRFGGYYHEGYCFFSTSPQLHILNDWEIINRMMDFNMKVIKNNINILKKTQQSLSQYTPPSWVFVSSLDSSTIPRLNNIFKPSTPSNTDKKTPQKKSQGEQKREGNPNEQTLKKCENQPYGKKAFLVDKTYFLKRGEKSQLKNELSILKHLQDFPFFPKCIEIIKFKNEEVLQMNHYSDQRSNIWGAYSFLAEKGEFFSYIYQVTIAVNILHSLGIFHGDIKNENTIWDRKNLKLIDFGGSCFIKNGIETYTGTHGHMAPEVLDEEEITLKADIYSLGVLFGRSLFCHARYSEIFFIQTKNLDCLAQVASDLGYPDLSSLIIRMLDTNPENRPSSSQLLNELQKMLKKYHPSTFYEIKDLYSNFFQLKKESKTKFSSPQKISSPQKQINKENNLNLI